MPLLAALLLAAAPPAPEMRSEKRGDREYRIILTAPGLTLAEGQLKAMQEAARLCGGYPVTLGHYRWRSEERMAGASGTRSPVALTLEQEAACAVAPPPPAPVPQPTGWHPTAADVTAVLDLTARYFAARDSGRYREAWSLLTPSMQEMSPLAEWQARAAAFNGRAEGKLQRKPVSVTWYDNPANAPVAGIFAAVDFLGEAKKFAFVCGYLVWLRQPDGSWRLTREEQGVIERADARRSKPEQLAQAKSAMGCPNPA